MLEYATLLLMIGVWGGCVGNELGPRVDLVDSLFHPYMFSCGLCVISLALVPICELAIFPKMVDNSSTMLQQQTLAILVRSSQSGH